MRSHPVKYPCKLCGDSIYKIEVGKKEHEDLVRVKTDLFGTSMDELFHASCYEKMKIDK